LSFAPPPAFHSLGGRSYQQFTFCNRGKNAPALQCVPSYINGNYGPTPRALALRVAVRSIVEPAGSASTSCVTSNT